MKDNTDYAGIDYGLGHSNIDKTNGIHYGVISQHTVGERWYEDSEPDYGEPTCPKCGNEVVEFDDDKHGEYERCRSGSCQDFACEHCKVFLNSDEVWADEPCGFNYEDSEYTLTDCLDSDIFVLKSPYYTHAQFCSPCVPGAGNLDNPCENGPKTYALGPEWFEDEKTPYPLFRVSDNSKVD